MAQNRKKLSTDRKQFSMELSVAELLGWTGLLLVVCLWFFILGVLVGRGIVPAIGIGTPLEKELAQARDEILKQKEAAARPDAELDFHEALKEDKMRPMVTPRAVPPVVAKTSPPAAGPAVKASPPASKAPPEKAIPADTDKIFTIQIAAVKDPQAAEEMIEKLKEKGFDAYSIQAELADGVVWHRIRCGAFESREAAAPLLSSLKEAGFGPMLVRR